jgi:4-hydroxy-2-oxoheptanedioate aldolase
VSRNQLKEKWAAGQSVVGAWCCLGSAFGAELCAVEGFDYVCVDLQHGLCHFDTMAPVLAAISRTGVSPIVRVPANQPHYMGKAFDAGAEAVVVPMVNSRADAERAVGGCRYAPEGTRSFGPVRSALFLNQAPPLDVNREALCLVMIETMAAVERVEEICSTPGVDGVYIGPADLAVTMGLAPGFGEMSREHASAIEHVREVCAANGVVVGIHTSGGAQARAYLDGGFRMASVSTDAALLRAAHRAELAIARGLRTPDRGGATYG